MYETESDTELGFLPGVEREIHNTRGGRPRQERGRPGLTPAGTLSSRWAGGRNLRGTEDPAEGGRHSACARGQSRAGEVSENPGQFLL